MSAIATPDRAESEALGSPARTRTERLATAIPLASVYVWLCLVYLVEVWKRSTPWLFSDELELTQLSRSIAATGHAARRGVPHSADSLYVYLTAPLWLIDDVGTAYSAIKYLDVFVMASVVFPTYFLARLVAGRRASLFAAAGAAAIPSLAYSSYIVEETLAYPYAALCFFLIAKALVEFRRSRRWRRSAIAAVLAALIAPAVRGELVVIPIVLVLSVLFAIWSSDEMRRRRATWSFGDWIGTVVLTAGVLFTLSGVASRNYPEWYEVSTFWKHRAFVLGDWAAGAVAIGTGVIPMVAGLAALVRSPGELPSRQLRMFRSVSVAGLIGFGLYTGMKATYLANHFATRVEERNLIYVSPLLFVGTAIVFERRRVNLLAVLAAAAYVLYLIVGTPFFMDRQLYSDALGLAVLEQANRYVYWTPDTAQWVLLGILAGGTAILLVPRFLPGRERLAIVLTGVLAAGILGWTLTGEIAAAAGTKQSSDQAATTLGRPFSWADAVAHGRPTLYFGEGQHDPNAENLLEFWNRSIVRVSSQDGTVNGPGPADGPNLSADGTLHWTAGPVTAGPSYDFAVEDWPCVDFAGRTVAVHNYRAGGETRKAWRLVELTHPNRLRGLCSGVYPDGWSGASSTYFHFPRAAGWLEVTVSRKAWNGPTGPSPVHVIVSPLAINANQQPILTSKRTTYDLTIDSTQTKVCWIRAPAGRLTAMVVVDKPFVPQDYGQSDGRLLGAQVVYAFRATRPSGTPSTCS